MSTSSCALLSRLCSEPNESEWLEFKHNTWDPDQIGRNVSALANSAMLAGRDRAFIVFGIEGGTHRRLGTSVRLKKKKGRGNENFENWINRIIAPRIMLELHDFECDDIPFSIIEIEPGYECPVRFDGATYIRIGENTRPLMEFPERERSLWITTGSRRFEDAVAKSNATQSEVHALLDIDGYFGLANAPRPRAKAAALASLVAARYLRDRMDGFYDITNLGALLLARDLRSFSALGSKIPRVVKYKGANKLRSEPERLLSQGYAVGFAEVLEHVLSLQVEERIVDGRRTVSPSYHSDILRELIANALVHQDLTISGAGPMIEVFSNRIEISNPGGSLIDRDRMINDKRSRNERLAFAMRDLGLCEERGSGLDKAFQAAEDSGLPAFDIVISETSTQITILAPTAFKEMKRGDRLRSLYYHCALRYAAKDYMTNASLRERFGLPQGEMQTITDLITAAKKAGRIAVADPDQGKKNARYVPYWAEQ
ncbi:MAG: ATP-binding protein [Vitreimonas sp.]